MEDLPIDQLSQEESAHLKLLRKLPRKVVQREYSSLRKRAVVYLLVAKVLAGALPFHPWMIHPLL